MEYKFSVHNDFKKYAREQDNGIYDNGWMYKEEHYSSYAFDEKRFGRIESETLVESLHMLRDDKQPNKTIILHLIDKQHHELWSGFVKSQDDDQAMMTIVNKFIEEYKNKSGAI